MSKPVVLYSQCLEGPFVGRRAACYIVSKHPVLGTIEAPKWVHTSQVLRVDESGFETLNTQYKKAST